MTLERIRMPKTLRYTPNAKLPQSQREGYGAVHAETLFLRLCGQAKPGRLRRTDRKPSTLLQLIEKHPRTLSATLQARRAMFR